ncbi:MAG: DUF3237 domain-containing protein [Burkholderiales bacterium]|nr:DUF3237 domain-containing protein [Burkholderiales bacterium]
MQSRPLFRLRAQVATPQVAAAAPYGDRRFIPVTGGTFEGERLAGRLLAGGADCQLIRADGVADLDVRVTFETSDGVIFYMKGLGMRHGPPDVMARIAAGEHVPGREYYFREAMFFEAPKGPYAWLNRLIAIGIGERGPDFVQLDVFEVL